MINYIGDNLEKGLTLAKMAGAVHMSPYHFSRLFKESTGFTPHHYVIERRVQRAEGRLVLVVWMLMFAALSWALYTRARIPEVEPAPATAGLH